jgi:ubiquinone biosynthesis protein
MLPFFIEVNNARSYQLVFREAVGDINRLRQVLQIVVKHGFGDMIHRARIFERVGIRPEQTKEDRVREPAKRLTRMLTELGPTYVKVGQLLSSRPDLIPEEYTTALRTLQDNVEPAPFEKVEQIIEEDFGKSIENLFTDFSTEPIASASIAQVHSATTHDGLKVAVKVKRSGIEGKVRADLNILYYLAHLMDAVVEESALYNPVEIVRQFDQALGNEMDLRREANNLRTFVGNFQDRTTLVIPTPVEHLCSTNILTMEYIEGQRFNEVESGSELAQKAALNLIEGFYQQAFEDGFFHSDPHPGNLRILPDGRVGLLDFGQTGKLSTNMRNSMMLLGLGIVLRDAETVARIVYRIGAQVKKVDLGELKNDIQQTLEQGLEKELANIDTSKLLQRLLDLSLRHQVRIPAEYTLICKSLATAEGCVRTLHPELNPATVLAPYVKRLLVEHYNLDDLRGGFLRGLLQFTHFFNDLPKQATQLLIDLEGGRLTLNTKNPEITHLRRTVSAVGIDLFWGLIAVGLLVVSLPPLMSNQPTPTAAIWGLIGSATISTIVTLRYFLTPVIRKMRLRPWLERRWGNRR